MSEKLCLITGGGSGIGRATALKFAQNKINTIIVGRRNCLRCAIPPRPICDLSTTINGDV